MSFMHPNIFLKIVFIYKIVFSIILCLYNYFLKHEDNLKYVIKK